MSTSYSKVDTIPETPPEKERAVMATILACIEGWVAELRPSLIKEEFFVTPDPVKKDGKTAIHHAAENGHIFQIPKDFLTKETLLLKDKSGQTPLEVIASANLPSNYTENLVNIIDLEMLTKKNKEGKMLIELMLKEDADNAGMYKKPRYKEENPNIYRNKNNKIKKLLEKVPEDLLEILGKSCETPKAKNLVLTVKLKRELQRGELNQPNIDI